MRRNVGRRQGPGIVGTAAKTAVVAGTATATVGVVHHAMGGGNQPPPAPAPAPAAPAAAPTAATGLSSDQIARLQEIAKLRDQGVLTEAEFQAQKQRILAG